MNRNSLSSVMAFCLVLGFFARAFAQDRAKEIAEARMARISASSMCQKTRASGRDYRAYFKVDSQHLQHTLQALAGLSDVVLVTARPLGGYLTISLEGDTVVSYWDARVLRSYKGNHKPGDFVTVAFPGGSVKCDDDGKRIETDYFHLGVRVPVEAPRGFAHPSSGPYILFLRRISDENGTPEYRLASGDGVQGMFSVHDAKSLVPDAGSDCWCAGSEHPVAACNNPPLEYVPKCISQLDLEKSPIQSHYREDPLKNFDGTPFFKFLQAVQRATENPSDH